MATASSQALADIKAIAIKGKGRQRRAAAITWLTSATGEASAANLIGDTRGFITAIDDMLTAISLAVGDVQESLFDEACDIITARRQRRHLSGVETRRILRLLNVIGKNNRHEGDTTHGSSGSSSPSGEEGAAGGMDRTDRGPDDRGPDHLP